MQFRLTVLFILILLFSGCADISTSHSTFLHNGNFRVKKSIKTWQELRERNVVMQKHDYSCGAAAIATLMRYYFQDAVSEKEILDDITGNFNEVELNKRKEKGFSLLDLKMFAERRGYIAIGTKLKLASLSKLRGPILVFLNLKDYKHFAILRGIKENRVFIADPSRGNLQMSLSRFAEEWDGISLVLGKKGVKASLNHSLKIRENEHLVKLKPLLVKKTLNINR